MLLLLETPAGFALFKVLDEGKLSKVEDLSKEFATVDTARKISDLLGIETALCETVWALKDAAQKTYFDILKTTIGISSVVAAMIGLSILLFLRVLDWDDCLSEKSAWDTLAWFAVLVGMAGQLKDLGIVAWMSGSVSELLQALSLSWPVAFVVLQIAYFLIHYLFESQIGHVGALYSAFLAMHVASGALGMLSALALAYNTSLFGAITHYSSGQAAVFFGAITHYSSDICHL